MTLNGPVAEAVGWALLHLIWQGAVVAAILAAVLALLDRRSANARYAASCAALTLLLVLGIATGIRAYEPLAEARSETWQRIIAVNLLSYAYLAREAIPGMRTAGGGSIVNVSSTHAMNPRAGMGQYDVTKSGILSLTRTRGGGSPARHSGQRGLPRTNSHAVPRPEG